MRHHCSWPHATSTAPPHQQSRHTCSGYGSRRSPEPCSCRSDPWPCIRAWLVPWPRSVLSQRTQRTWRSDRCSFARDATHPRIQILLEVPNACVLCAPKQVTRSINKKRQCPGPGRICRLPSWVAHIKGGVVLFRHRRIGIVEMAICKIDTSFPLHGRQLLQAGPLPLRPPRTICSSTDSVTATRRLRLRGLRWANLGAMHCQSCPRLSVAGQVDSICFLAKLDCFLLGPSGC